jgi:4-hydroxymandelate oxidase
MEPINIFEFEAAARERLPLAEYDFIAGGATDEVTIRRSRAVFDAICLRPKVLTGVDIPDLSTTVLGQRIEFPVLAAPAGHHGRAHRDGECATARACGGAGIVMVLSSGSSFSLEEVSAAATGPLWYQQYLYKDSSLTKAMAARAADAGYQALCVTLDSGVPNKRERNIRNRYVVNAAPAPNYNAIPTSELSWRGGGDEPRGVGGLIDRTATWATLAELVSSSSLPIVVKGVLVADDAALAVDAGSQAVIVSNHGGRQLDTTITSLEALPEIVAAVDGRAEVYLDGGIRRGTDIIKALALGARAVLIGRPLYWGLAVDGERGVAAVLRILREELQATLAMCGMSRATHVDSSLVALASPLTSPPVISVYDSK